MTAPPEPNTTLPWREVVDAANPKECYEYATGFRRAAKDTKDATQKALLLLSDVCEPFLRDEGDDVLAPRDRVDALTVEQLDALSPLLAADTDAELRARVGDHPVVAYNQFAVGNEKPVGSLTMEAQTIPPATEITQPDIALPPEAATTTDDTPAPDVETTMEIPAPDLTTTTETLLLDPQTVDVNVPRSQRS